MAPALRPALAALAFTAVWGRYEPLTFPGTCSETTYFDTSALQCLACPTGQQPDPAGTGCECSDSKVLSGATCVACNGTGAAPTRDRTACIPCTIVNDTCADATTGLDTDTSECGCPDGKVREPSL